MELLVSTARRRGRPSSSATRAGPSIRWPSPPPDLDAPLEERPLGRAGPDAGARPRGGGPLRARRAARTCCGSSRSGRSSRISAPAPQGRLAAEREANMALSIQVEEGRSFTKTLRLVGRLDNETAGELDRELDEVLGTRGQGAGLRPGRPRVHHERGAALVLPRPEGHEPARRARRLFVNSQPPGAEGARHRQGRGPGHRVPQRPGAGRLPRRDAEEGAGASNRRVRPACERPPSLRRRRGHDHRSTDPAAGRR